MLLVHRIKQYPGTFHDIQNASTSVEIQDPSEFQYTTGHALVVYISLASDGTLTFYSINVTITRVHGIRVTSLNSYVSTES